MCGCFFIKHFAMKLMGTPELSINFIEVVSPETTSTLRNFFLRLYYKRNCLYSLSITLEVAGYGGFVAGDKSPVL